MDRSARCPRPRNRGYLAHPVGVPRVELSRTAPAGPPLYAPPAAPPPRVAPVGPRQAWLTLSEWEAICWPAAEPGAAIAVASAEAVAKTEIEETPGAPAWALAPLALAAPPFALDGFIDLTVPPFALDALDALDIQDTLDALTELTPPWPMLVR